MGMAKAMLPFGDETMLQRVVRLLGEVVVRRVVVAAVDQPIPALGPETEVAFDRHPGRGPLEGIAAGLAALEGIAAAAYVTSCDVPLLNPDFVRRMFDLLGDADVAAPHDGRFYHPLAAVYRTTVLPAVRSLLEQQQYRPVFLFDRVRTNRVDVESLRDVDPTLATLENLNRPEDYAAALRRAGIPMHPDIARQLGMRSGGTAT
jgi:molybdopterin-guanine dinucleotide biosynthesis protein A